MDIFQKNGEWLYSQGAILQSICAPFFVLFFLSAIYLGHVDLDWHDQQRVSQILLLLAIVFFSIFFPQQNLPKPVSYALLGIFASGLISCFFAELPGWALKEWARYVGLALLAIILGYCARKPVVRRFMLWGMASVGFIHAFQFLVAYASAFLSGMYMLDAGMLFRGFSNPRFFGQFQVMLLPVLALLIREFRQQGRRGLTAILLTVLAVQWCIALTLGGRGLWLGLAVSHAALFCVSRSFWRLLVIQLMAGLLGAILLVVMFHLIPDWLEITPKMRDTWRFTLSGRGPLWQWAWEMALANPWFGVGPMHYAATLNPIATHPHQVILQWAAEWGFVATALAMLLAGWGVIHGVMYLRRNMASHHDAALWLAIVGALVLAQVDGVFVMPYTETWLAILIGLVLARWSTAAKSQPLQRYASLLLALPVMVVFSLVLLEDVPRLAENKQVYSEKHGGSFNPRFWQQGWIPLMSEPATH